LLHQSRSGGKISIKWRASAAHLIVNIIELAVYAAIYDDNKLGGKRFERAITFP
jgi:hypothetical protein